MGPETTTRRQLVCGGMLATVGASALVRPAASGAASRPAPTDATVLQRILRVEQLVVIGYRWALASAVLSAGIRAQLRGLLGQELQHVAILKHELSARRTAAPSPPSGVVAVQSALLRHHIHTSPGALHTQHQWLRLLIDLESVAEGAYFSAISKLSDPPLLRTSAEIMGSEAQHWTMLSAIQHHGDVEKSVPYPFVQGSS